MGAVIIEDTRQHDGKHEIKHKWWRSHGVEFAERATALPAGDYACETSNILIDTKRDIYELMGNLGSGYRRLDHECRRAYEAGYRLVFLVERGEMYARPELLDAVVAKPCRKCASYVARLCRPDDPNSGCKVRGDRRKPFQGYQVLGRMKSLHRKYGAEFEFCEPIDSAQRICELLGVEYS